VTQTSALRVIVVILLVWYIGPVAPFMPAEAFSSENANNGLFEEQMFLRLSWLPVYLITFLLAVPRLPAVWRAAMWSPLIVVLLALAMASMLWSLAPADTLRRCFAITGTTLLGLYLAARFEPRELIRLLGWAFAVIMVLSVVFVAVKPAVGISGPPHPGAWRGVFSHKNGLGQTMLLALITFGVLGATSRRRGWPIALAIGAAGLLVLSTSKTPLAVAAVLVIVGLLVWAMHRHPDRAGYLGALAVIAALAAPFVVFVVLEPVLTLLGRDLTLTGRTDIWRLVWGAIQQRPLLGYGYSGFWTATMGPVLDIWFVAGWQVPNAHQGFLDLLLAFGAVGLLLYALLLLRTMIRTLRLVRRGDPWGALWSICVLTLFLIYGFVESNIMEQNKLSWVLFVALAAYAGRPERSRLGRPSSACPRNGTGPTASTRTPRIAGNSP
jgi:exopolysaccharide production protein ExoQ